MLCYKGIYIFIIILTCKAKHASPSTHIAHSRDKRGGGGFHFAFLISDVSVFSFKRLTQKKSNMHRHQHTSLTVVTKEEEEDITVRF